MSKRIHIFITAIATSIVTASAVAQTAFSQTAPSINNCEGSTYDQQICVSVALKNANAELEKVFREHLITLQNIATNSPNATIRRDANEIERRLVASQRTWSAFRDFDCEFQSAKMLGGSGEGVAHDKCMLAMTVARLKQLKEFSF